MPKAFLLSVCATKPVASSSEGMHGSSHMHAQYLKENDRKCSTERIRQTVTYNSKEEKQQEKSQRRGTKEEEEEEEEEEEGRRRRRRGGGGGGRGRGMKISPAGDPNSETKSKIRKQLLFSPHRPSLPWTPSTHNRDTITR